MMSGNLLILFMNYDKYFEFSEYIFLGYHNLQPTSIHINISYFQILYITNFGKLNSLLFSRICCNENTAIIAPLLFFTRYYSSCKAVCLCDSTPASSLASN
jgi:hypothetical protein